MGSECTAFSIASVFLIRCSRALYRNQIGAEGHPEQRVIWAFQFIARAPLKTREVTSFSQPSVNKRTVINRLPPFVRFAESRRTLENLSEA